MKRMKEIIRKTPKVPLRAPHAPALTYITKLIDPAAAAGRYPVLCAWCEEQGRRTVVGYTTAKQSHGICPEHGKALLLEYEASIAARRKENATPTPSPTSVFDQGETTITV